MSSPTSQNVELIKQMGLTDDEAIRDALHQAENDVDAALQILLPDTEGNPPSGIDSQSSYERIDSYDIEMKVCVCVSICLTCNSLPFLRIWRLSQALLQLVPVP